MRNVYINEAETVFEAFWDSGDTYPGHEKYSALKNYEMTVKNKATEKAKTVYNGISITVGASDGYSVTLKRSCKLKINDFNKFIFSGVIPTKVWVMITCKIDGEKKTVIEESGGKKEFEGDISGGEITEIEITFKNTAEGEETVLLSWMGLANSKRREEMLKRENGFDSEWEGCFSEEYKTEPDFQLFFKREETENIRKKVQKKPFLKIMENLREYAKLSLDIEPEKLIGRYVDFHEPRFGRERDIDTKRQPAWKIMETLAFVGMIDKKPEYLKLACRWALSVSSCENWYESFLGDLPGTTWHHRSFKEGVVAAALAKVLSYAGGMLTWHGKNIIYNAIIMKGIPRLEADIRTMDYIWHMNQGIVFSSVYIIALVALEKKYPRYNSLIEEMRKNIDIMWNNYILADGGACEGAGYWNYSAEYYLMAMYVLAVRDGKTIEEFCGERLEKSRLYAECMISTAGDGTNILPLNDTRTDKQFDLINLAFFARTGGSIWKNAFEKTAEGIKNTTLTAEAVIIAPEFLENDTCEEKEEFIVLKDTGCVSVKRKKQNLLLVSGPVIFGHSHEDKGSVILENDGEALFIDRGVCDYGNSEVAKFSKALWHNLLVPIKDGNLCSQKNMEGFGGEIIPFVCEDGVVITGTDITKAWEECEKCFRFIVSPEPELLLIYDILEYKDRKTKSDFILNTYGNIKPDGERVIVEGEKNRLQIVPVNYTPENTILKEDGCDGGGRRVNKIHIITSKSQIVTAIILNDEDAEFSEDTIIYKNNRISFKENKVIINDKETELFICETSISQLPDFN